MPQKYEKGIILSMVERGEALLTSEGVNKAENNALLYSHEVFLNVHQMSSPDGVRITIREHLEYGTFGSIYSVSSPRGNFILATDLINNPWANGDSLARFYNQRIAGSEGEYCFWALRPSGIWNDYKWKYFFFNNIGRNVADVRKYHMKKNFCPVDALRIAFEMYRTIEGLHQMNYVHGDLTLCSFSFGVGDSSKRVLLTYFGRLRQHLVQKKPCKARVMVPIFPRNMVYASRSAHKRRDFGRMDDLESWLYIMGDLFDDCLPEWKTNRRMNRQIEQEMLKKKESFLNGEKMMKFVYFDRVPKEFAPLVPLIAEGKYETEIDNEKFRNSLRAAKARIGATSEYKWKGHELDTSIYPKVSVEEIRKEKKMREKEREEEKEKQRQKTIEQEKERVKTLEKEKEKQKTLEKEKEKLKTLVKEKEKLKTLEKEKLKTLEKEKEKLKTLEKENEKLANEREKQREKEKREKEKKMEMEREKQKEKEKALKKERSRASPKTSHYVEDREENKKVETKKKRILTTEEEESNDSSEEDDNDKKKKSRKKKSKTTEKEETIDNEKRKKYRKKASKTTQEETIDNEKRKKSRKKASKTTEEEESEESDE